MFVIWIAVAYLQNVNRLKCLPYSYPPRLQLVCKWYGSLWSTRIDTQSYEFWLQTKSKSIPQIRSSTSRKHIDKDINVYCKYNLSFLKTKHSVDYINILSNYNLTLSFENELDWLFFNHFVGLLVDLLMLHAFWWFYNLTFFFLRTIFQMKKFNCRLYEHKNFQRWNVIIFAFRQYGRIGRRRRWFIHQ